MRLGRELRNAAKTCPYPRLGFDNYGSRLFTVLRPLDVHVLPWSSPKNLILTTSSKSCQFLLAVTFVSWSTKNLQLLPLEYWYAFGICTPFSSFNKLSKGNPSSAVRHSHLSIEDPWVIINLRCRGQCGIRFGIGNRSLEFRFSVEAAYSPSPGFLYGPGEYVSTRTRVSLRSDLCA